MTKLSIKSWITGAVLYEGEAETLRDLVRTAVSSRADLSRANLYGADLSEANLYGANLYGQHIFSFAGVGRSNRMTTYWVEAKKIWCGCFTGTPQEFIALVEKTHANNPKHLAEYRAGISFLRSCLRAIPKDELAAGKKAYAEMMTKAEAKAVA